MFSERAELKKFAACTEHTRVSPALFNRFHSRFLKAIQGY